MFASSIVLGGGGINKILMICSSFVHLSRPIIAGMVKFFVRNHYPPSHVPAGSSVIILLSVHPTTPSLYKKFTCSTASCGSNDTHIQFLCVCCVCMCVGVYIYIFIFIYTPCVHSCKPFWSRCHGFADSVIEYTLTDFTQHSQKIYSIRKWCDIVEKTIEREKTVYGDEV